MSWPHDYWPRDQHEMIRALVQTANAGALPEWAIAADLVYLSDLAQHPTRPEPMPGRRLLEKRWGVSERVARRCLADPGWRSKCEAAKVAVPERGIDGRKVECPRPRTTSVPAPVPPLSPPLSPPLTNETVKSTENVPASVPASVPATVPPASPPTSSRALYGPTVLRSYGEEEEASGGGLEDAPTEIEDDDRQVAASEPELAFPLRLVAPREGGNEPPSPALTEGTKIALRAHGLRGGNGVAALTRKELLEVPGIGKKRLDEIEAWLGSHKLTLKAAPLDEARLIQRCAETWAETWATSPWKTSKYPWELAGADRERLKKWIGALDLPGESLADGLVRLKNAISAYLDAVSIGKAWPEGAPPTTRAFTTNLTDWILEGDRRKPAAQASKSLENPYDARRGTLGRELRYTPKKQQ